MASEADPRNSGYRALGAHVEREGFEFQYRELTPDRPAGIDKWKDHYLHADGRGALVFQADSGEYCNLVEQRETEH